MGHHHGSVLRSLRDIGPLSRADLARLGGLSPTTLTHVTAQLLREGVIMETDAPPSEHAAIGRPAQALRIAREARMVAGVNIGAGHVELTLADLLASPKGWRSFTFDRRDADPRALVRDVARNLAELADEAQLDRTRLLGIGLSVPRPVAPARRNAQPAINVGWRDVPLADYLQQETGLPVAMEHNVSAMALAETRFGIGRGVPALLFVYLRTGLGAGLVVDGALFRPGGHGAVELGHIQMAARGAVCACGNRGCLETFVCEAALMRDAGLSGVAPEGLMGEVEQRNPAAWKVIVGHLTTGLANAVNLLTPDMIVFGGHLGEAPDSLFQRLKTALPPRVMPHLRDLLDIRRSSFGRRAGVVGGAVVALETFFYSGGVQ
ncbi:ROK family transcriptional regulator [Alsobacter sp. R-9]